MWRLRAARRGNIVAFLSYTQDLFYTGSSIENGLPLLIVSPFRGFHLLISRSLSRMLNRCALNWFGLFIGKTKFWFQRPAHAKIYYHCYRRSYPSVWIVLTVLCASINVASFRFFWSGEKTGFSPLLNCLNILRSVFSPFVGFVWVCKKQSFTILDSWLIRGSLALFVGCTPCTTLRQKALALTLPRHGTYLIECLVVLICCNVKSNFWGFDVYTSTSV